MSSNAEKARQWRAMAGGNVVRVSSDVIVPSPYIVDGQPATRIGGCCDPSTKLDDGLTVMVSPPTEHRPVKRLPGAPV